MSLVAGRSKSKTKAKGASKRKPKAREFAAGEVIFQEEDASDVMYVVQAGEIEIVRHTGVGAEARLLAIVPAGEFFGEMGLINGRPRSATARARTDAKLLEIDAPIFETMVQQQTEIAIRMIKTLSSRLERANNQAELLLLNDPGHRLVECLRQMAEEAGEDEENSVHLPVPIDQLASSVMLTIADTREILNRLGRAKLIAPDGDRGGYVLPDYARLLEFLEFLEVKERFLSAGE